MLNLLRWQDIIDILVVAFIIYRTFLLIKGTRAIQLVVGLTIVFLAFYLARKAELFTVGWILSNFVGSIVVVIVVIFQNDLRRILLAIGRSPFFRKIGYVQETLFYEELANGCQAMASKRLGALVVIEREAGLEEFMEVGTLLDAEVNTELILSIFQRSSPLHDGAMMIREGRIKAAGCILPLTLKDSIDRGLGTRHRAAIGITEVTDAVAVVVSEEKGIISYAFRGEIFLGVTEETLKSVLKEVLG